jgi:hydrogenase/urease accessory protein HupE
MQYLKLALALAFFVPVCTILGAFLTLDTGTPLWFALTLGAAFGVFFGLVFGGNPRWRFWDYIWGPAEENEDEREERPVLRR